MNCFEIRLILELQDQFQKAITAQNSNEGNSTKGKLPLWKLAT